MNRVACIFLIVGLAGWSASLSYLPSQAREDRVFRNEPSHTEPADTLCLTEINHPDLFFWKWKFPPVSSEQPIAQQQNENERYNPVLIERPTRRAPIPLNQLDNSLVQRVHFGFDQDILDAEAKSGIQINAEWIKLHTDHDILLEGHCDERGTDEYNIALGERRASAVRDYMVRLGIPLGRIITRSYGEEKPLDSSQTESAYSLNRRVEFYAVP